MAQVKNLDTTSVRGERSVDVGLGTAAGKALLKDFNFNINSILGAVLYKPYAVTTATGVIKITDFVPANDVAFPSGATHVSLQGAFAIIDFDLGTSEVEYTQVENLPIDMTSGTVTLTPAATPTGTGIKLYFLQISFYQEVNGVQYSLNNGAYNAFAIIEVI
ncbi:hypothetical protein [Ilyomonas limi]|uniref:hypothetical protein n=1 Tax=Ilyomonas limi TaxID=2575867 RepID=UPI00197D7D14|nr:hypothetical protein [Ilyomonas limi]